MESAPPDAQLRLAVALCHSVTGASLHLTTTVGRSIVATRDGGTAELDPCELRRLLATRPAGASPCWLSAVERLELGGALDDHGGGLHSFAWRRTRVWVFATLLAPHAARATVDEVLDGAGGHPSHGSAMPTAAELELQVVPDDLLGVSLVFAPEQPELDPTSTRDTMRAISAACIVREMVGGALIAGER